MKAHLLLSLLCAVGASSCAAADNRYAIVVSKDTAADPAWAKVVSKLQQKHSGRILTFTGSVDTALPELKALHPRWTCFVARPDEAGRAFVQTVHRVTRQLDDDPYTDTLWGILTGFDAANALEIASQEKPLTVHKAGSGTELAMDRIESGTWYCELRKGHMVTKSAGGKPEEHAVPADTTKALVDLINEGTTDLWVTSGHATERDWMIGFRYKNGFWKSKTGRLYGEDTAGKTFDVQSPNPKVYLAVGNCLMGHIDGPDAMALAWLKSAGVCQMAGYVLPTWYGYQGWGLLDYFVEQPGRYTLTEAFFANQHALIHRLMTAFPGAERIGPVDDMGRPLARMALPRPSEAARELGLGAQDMQGLLFDRDNVAFYGDPAWEARMADGRKNWTQELKVKGSEHTLVITPDGGRGAWEPVNRNGSQRGGRPVIAYLPRRIDPAKVNVTAGGEWKPVIADDFILVPLPAAAEGPLTITFTVQE